LGVSAEIPASDTFRRALARPDWSMGFFDPTAPSARCGAVSLSGIEMPRLVVE
jgi:hypothetical protein